MSVGLSLALCLWNQTQTEAAALPEPALPPQILKFCADKQSQVGRLARKLKLEVPQIVEDCFNSAKTGDWVQAIDMAKEARAFVNNSSNDPAQRELDATVSAALIELLIAIELFTEGSPKHSLACGTEIVKSIPAGAIYFGGTDAGRGLPTALCTSHEKGDPFFTLTQNALAAGNYLAYLRTMYGGKISIPSEKDSSATFQEYLQDAQRRAEHDQEYPNEPKQLKPGEDVKIRDGRVNVSGQVAVSLINGRLAKNIFEKNPDREFFIEQSFPFDWMQPHLSPHGLILKVNRQPLASLPAEVVTKDRQFWTNQTARLIGDWLKPETSIKEVCAFAEKVFVNRELKGFAGDATFVESMEASKMYSKLRSSIAQVYAGRAKRAQNANERERMQREADFACKQAFALCPSNPEAVFHYISFLKENKRQEEALLVAQTASSADPSNNTVLQVIDDLKRARK